MEQFFRQLKPLQPIATDERFRNRLTPDEVKAIKAVVFDVYGTILISSSGDIFEFKHGKESIVEALKQAGIECNGHHLDLEFGEAVVREFLSVIKEHHREKAARGISYPEVEIEDVWNTVLERMEESKFIDSREGIDIQTLAISFEFLSNPTFPMPGLKALLQTLERRKFRKGIISNAQFFTPILLRYFLGEKDFLRRIGIPYFEDDLIRFSYRQGCAKPEISLFTDIRDILAKEGTGPGQVLFVGNDMLNDIYPAKVAGFKTVLFAGDKRSLRHRRYAAEVKDLEPDVVITHLDQIGRLLTA